MKKDDKFLKKDPEFHNLVKKAKRDSNIRVIFISLIVSIIVVTAFYFIGNSIMQKAIDKEMRSDAMWYSIHGANIEPQGTSVNYSLTSATTKTEFSKIVNGIPVPWVPKEKRYSILGTSKLITAIGATGTGGAHDKRIPMYYNGKRAIEFIHPGAHSATVDDKELISDISNDKVIELALSFDKSYDLKKVQSAFNEHLSWYWVNSYSQSDIKDFNEEAKRTGKDYTISGDDVIGFRHSDQQEDNWGANAFIQTITSLQDEKSYSGLAKNIMKNVTKDNQQDMSAENLEMIGVVVTGSPSEIQKYLELPMVRAAFLGVTAEKY
ncbi:hypothetical protein FZC66_17845 [Priestia megaterium]|nr:hypothetical protein FZC66_17845 [Priestia megaterium]